MKSNLRIYILDDEPASVEMSEYLIRQVMPEAQIVGTSNEPMQAIQEINLLKPDLLILDIQMPRMSGFDVMEKLGKEAPAVIFITAYDQFAIRAIKFSALDYLLKPIDPDELREALDKVVQHHREEWQQEKMMQLLLQLTEKDGIPGKIGIPVQDGIKFIPVQQILYLKADDNYTEIFVQGASSVLASKTLKHFEDLLKERGFVRIHQSWLIQLQHMEEYLKADGGSVRMTDGRVLPVSRQRKDGLMELLGG